MWVNRWAVSSIFLHNMDRYDAGVGKKQKSNEERLRDLVEAMEDIRANWMPAIEDDQSMSVTWCKYMFYDHDFLKVYIGGSTVWMIVYHL
jgi:hypothetical protein